MKHIIYYIVLVYVVVLHAEIFGDRQNFGYYNKSMRLKSHLVEIYTNKYIIHIPLT